MRKLPVYILIDTSGSMQGKPIEAVRTGLSEMIDSLRLDPYALETACVSIITYDREARQILPMTPLDCLRLPEISCPESGPTFLGAALNLLCQCYDSEVNIGTAARKGDWMPLLFVLTDGKPSDLQDYEQAIERIRNRQFSNIVACAAGPKAKAEPLKKLTRNVFRLDMMDGKAFSKFFQWISTNVRRGGCDTFDATCAQLAPPPPEMNVVR